MLNKNTVSNVYQIIILGVLINYNYLVQAHPEAQHQINVTALNDMLFQVQNFTSELFPQEKFKIADSAELAEGYLILGQFKEADAVADNLLQAFPNNENYLILKSQAQGGLGNKKAEWQYAEKAAKANPASEHAIGHLFKLMEEKNLSPTQRAELYSKFGPSLEALSLKTAAGFFARANYRFLQSVKKSNLDSLTKAIKDVEAGVALEDSQQNRELLQYLDGLYRLYTRIDVEVGEKFFLSTEQIYQWRSPNQENFAINKIKMAAEQGLFLVLGADASVKFRANTRMPGAARFILYKNNQQYRLYYSYLEGDNGFYLKDTGQSFSDCPLDDIELTHYVKNILTPMGRVINNNNDLNSVLAPEKNNDEQPAGWKHYIIGTGIAIAGALGVYGLYHVRNQRQAINKMLSELNDMTKDLWNSKWCLEKQQLTLNLQDTKNEINPTQLKSTKKSLAQLCEEIFGKNNVKIKANILTIHLDLKALPEINLIRMGKKRLSENINITRSVGLPVKLLT